MSVPKQPRHVSRQSSSGVMKKPCVRNVTRAVFHSTEKQVMPTLFSMVLPRTPRCMVFQPSFPHVPSTAASWEATNVADAVLNVYLFIISRRCSFARTIRSPHSSSPPHAHPHPIPPFRHSWCCPDRCPNRPTRPPASTPLAAARLL